MLLYCLPFSKGKEKNMSINDILSKIINNEKAYEESNLEIVFASKELEALVGQWLGVLPFLERQGKNNSSAQIYLSARKLIEKRKVTSKESYMINSKFSQILENIGLTDDTCVLDRYDRYNYSFKCFLKNENKTLEIYLRIGNTKTITVKKQNELSTYECLEDGSVVKLVEKLVYGDNNLVYMSKDGKITYQTKHSLITIMYDEENNFPTEEIEHYLLSLHAPLNVNKVYHKLNKMLSDFEIVSIDIKTNKNEKLEISFANLVPKRKLARK